jgi:hypothetical protein
VFLLGAEPRSRETFKRTHVPPTRSCATQLGLDLPRQLIVVRHAELDHVCHEDQLAFPELRRELRREELSESVYIVEGTHNQYILQIGCEVEV